MTPLEVPSSPVRFFEVLGLVSGIALLLVLAWMTRRYLQGRKYQRMIRNGELPSTYRVSRSGRLIVPPLPLRRARPKKFVGITKEQLDTVAPVFTEGIPSTSRNRDSSECTICLEEVEASQAKRLLPCAHVYHSHCIEAWAAKQNACPLCRQKLLRDDNDEKQAEGQIIEGVEDVDMENSNQLDSTTVVLAAPQSSGSPETSRNRRLPPVRLLSPRRHSPLAGNQVNMPCLANENCSTGTADSENPTNQPQNLRS